MLDTIGEANALALVGLFGGILLGLAARLGRFCTLGAIEDHTFGGSSKRLAMWGFAIGLAVIGSHLALRVGAANLTDSFYLNLTWSPIASVIGGLAFGYGMALAGNCGYGAIARLGGGDLRSFVIVLVMGVATYFTLSGPLAFARIEVFGAAQIATSPQGFAFLLGDATGLPAVGVGVVIGIGICLWALSCGAFRTSPKAIFWSSVVALSVVSAWISTSYVARHGFDGTTPVSHTFAAPVGETILYFMTSSGQTLSFALGSVAGVWLGAFIGSLIKGHFRWEACEDPRELRRQIFGAGLMGFGAAVALGCSIGQGLSAFSLLSFSAPVTLASIFAGCWLGLTQLISGFSLSKS